MHTLNELCAVNEYTEIKHLNICVRILKADDLSSMQLANGVLKEEQVLITLYKLGDVCTV
jgi:hypothetical protein